MKKILYIKASPKIEKESDSKKLGRELVEKILMKHPNYEVEELDLWNDNIPEISTKYLRDEVHLIDPQEDSDLSDEDKKVIDRIDELSDQFIAADVYIIATPMWSVNFPYVLKKYIDCICLGGRVLYFKGKDKKPQPLLSDKKRAMIYLETSGGDFPMLLEGMMHHGAKYCKHLFKGIGVSQFEHIYIEGTIQYEDNKDKYMNKAYKDIFETVEKLKNISN